MKSLHRLVSLSALVLSSSFVHADVLQQIAYRVTVPSQTLGFRETVTVPAFDSTLGDLEGIRVRLDTWTSGRLAAENLGAEARTIRAQCGGQFLLEHPSGRSVIASTVAGSVLTLQLRPFDGRADFDGESGVVLGMETTQATSDVFVELERGDREAFSGRGRIAFPLVARSAGQVQGSSTGDVAARLVPSGSASVLVSYVYSARRSEAPMERAGRRAASTDAGSHLRGGASGSEAAMEPRAERSGLESARPRSLRHDRAFFVEAEAGSHLRGGAFGSEAAMEQRAERSGLESARPRSLRHDRAFFVETDAGSHLRGGASGSEAVMEQREERSGLESARPRSLRHQPDAAERTAERERQRNDRRQAGRPRS